MKLAPNQKRIVIHKEKPGQEGTVKPFSRINVSAQKNAVRQMNGRKAAGLIIWLILASNQPEHQLSISWKGFEEEYGISKDAYDSGIKILIEKGFLVRSNGNLFDFYEYPEKYKNGEMPLLKVGNSHNQKLVKATFKSGENPQPTYIYNTDNNTTNNNHDLSEVIASAAADAGFNVNKATQSKLAALADQYGDELLLAGINACVEGQAINLNYLRGCLTNMQKEAAGNNDQHGEPYLDDKHEYIGG